MVRPVCCVAVALTPQSRGGWRLAVGGWRLAVVSLGTPPATVEGIWRVVRGAAQDSGLSWASYSSFRRHSSLATLVEVQNFSPPHFGSLRLSSALAAFSTSESGSGSATPVPPPSAPRGANVLDTARQQALAIPSGQSKGMALTPLNVGLFIGFCILVVVVYLVRKR